MKAERALAVMHPEILDEWRRRARHAKITPTDSTAAAGTSMTAWRHVETPAMNRPDQFSDDLNSSVRHAT